MTQKSARILLLSLLFLSFAGKSGVICFEAENANMIYPNMEVIKRKDVSGGYCLGIREFAGNRDRLYSKTDKNFSSAIYGVNIAKDGDYAVILKVFWDDGCGNSFWVAVDDNKLYKASDQATKEWHWVKGGKYHLTKGIHRIVIREREDGVYLDKIALFSGDESPDLANADPAPNYLPIPVKGHPQIALDLSSDTKLIEPGKPVNCFLWLRDNRQVALNGKIAVNAKFAMISLPLLEFSLKPKSPAKIIPITLRYKADTPARQHSVRVDIFSGRKVLGSADLVLVKPFVWQVVGPFSYRYKQEAKHGPENRFEPSAKYQGKNGVVEWKQYAVDKLFNFAGLADFNKLFGETADASVFLYTVINSAREQNVNMNILCDDTCKVWLNHQLSAEKTISGPAVRGPVMAEVQLKKGRNTVLVQVNQRKGYWNFSVFFTEPNGALCKTIK